MPKTWVRVEAHDGRILTAVLASMIVMQRSVRDGRVSGIRD